MKTQKLMFSILTLLLMTTGLKATGNELEKKELSVLSLEKQLAENMTCPDFIHYQGVAVQIKIQFQVKNDFTVVVETIECKDEWLKQHIQRELSMLKLLVDKEKVGQSFSVSLTYK